MVSFSRMNCISNRSLQHIAIIKLAVTLWNQHDIRDITGQYFSLMIPSYGITTFWQVVEDKVIENVAKLSLPELLKREVLDIIKPIGEELRDWGEIHKCFVSMVKLKENWLCWTQQGTIDMKKTAEVLVKIEDLDITNRYIMSCIYCLESDIKMLWKKLPNGVKELFYNKINPKLVQQQELVVFWTYYIEGDVTMLMEKCFSNFQYSPYQYAFKCAVLCGNQAATEYFIQKLIPEEREESLEIYASQIVYQPYSLSTIFNACNTTFRKKHYTGVLCFLLSQMDKRQQTNLFKCQSYGILRSFLVWPWQSFLMEIASLVWTLIPEDHYYWILCDINSKLMDGYKDYNYQKLFQELWQQSPDNYKKHVVQEDQKLKSMYLLFNLFKTEDKETIAFILKNLSHTGKENLIFCRRGKDICKIFILKGNWNLVKLFVGECISSKEKVIRFKEEFEQYILRYFTKEQCINSENTWNLFFNVLDDLIHNYDKKRSTMDDRTNSLAKRERL